MADAKQANAGAGGVAAASGPQPTMAEYKKSQARVRELVEKRRALERRLVQVEDGINQKELAYLESTPSGNIITGFDNYMKGMTGAAAQRRKTGPMDQNRVFSKSSVSYRPNNGDSTTPGSIGSTPGSHAPTPISTSFRDTGSAQPTPTSAGGNKGGNKKKKNDKDKDKDKDKEVDDSEGDAQTTKKRANFGASRK